MPKGTKNKGDFSIKDVSEIVKCPICGITSEEEGDWVDCDGCSNWYHVPCVGIIPVPPDVEFDWVCSKCENPTGKEEEPETISTKTRITGVSEKNGNSDLKKTRRQEEVALIDELIELKARKLKLLQMDGADNVVTRVDFDDWEVESKLEYRDGSLNMDGESNQAPKKTGEFGIVNSAKPGPSGYKPIASSPLPSQMQQHSGNLNGTVVNGEVVDQLMKLVSRQHLQELPKFDGRPEKWALFYSTFEYTTRQGQYLPAENIVRLQSALTGHALDTFGPQLISPDCVPLVLEQMKDMYGRPNIVIKRMIGKLHTLSGISDKPKSLMNLLIEIRKTVTVLKGLGAVKYLENPSLVDEIVDRFPGKYKERWARYLCERLNKECSDATLIDLETWLNGMTKYMSVDDIGCFSEREDKGNKLNLPYKRVNAHKKEDPVGVNKVSSSGKCVVCSKEGHLIGGCPEFLAMSVTKRREIVPRYGLCYGCLRKGHQARQCKSKATCGVNDCHSKHHKLLHEERATHVNAVHHGNSKIYRILPIRVFAKNGGTVLVNAYLDEGSDTSMISKELSDRLGIQGTPSPFCVEWTDGTTRHERDSELVSLDIGSIQGCTRRFTLNGVRTVNCLNLPKPAINVHELKGKFKHLSGLDILQPLDEEPGILLGLEHPKIGLYYEVKEGSWNEPIATRTRLGWVLHGNMQEGGSLQSLVSVHKVFSMYQVESDQELHEMVKKSFTTEDFGVKPCKTPLLSRENDRAIRILQETTKDVGGRYETGLLWRFDDISLPDSRPMALKRLMSLEKQMDRDSEFKKVVTGKIRDNIEKGYARKLNEAELKDKSYPQWYLPIFAVKNPHKPGKIRMVYDAAAKTNGVCLNDVLLKGPDQLASLVGVLLKFREYEVGVSADIQEMFHRILIRPADRNAQRFLWRDGDVRKQIDTYVMTAMTFGATCSPSSAQFVKNNHAERYASRFPRAVESIVGRHYVDDLLDSFPNEETAIEVCERVKSIHADAGMNLRNWKANRAKVSNVLNGENMVEDRLCNLNMDTEGAEDKVLGLYWRTQTDEFVFKLNFVRVAPALTEFRRTPTKREFLRILMSLFDPLGFLAHMVIYAKILLREIWIRSVEWDEVIPRDLEEKWQYWFGELKKCEMLSVPRCYSALIPFSDAIELHVFMDASESAFSAVCYLRVSKGDLVECGFVCAKTRVAPKKTLSIPRLELQAAVLGSRLANSVIEELSIKIKNTVYWSDSRTTLAWIRSETRRFKQFVAQRVGEILDLTNVGDWRWVPGKLNVADDATKWEGKPDIAAHSRWYQGPPFLKEPSTLWPIETVQELPELPEELRVNVQTNIHSRYDVLDPSRFSKWERMVRAVAWLFRMKYRCSKLNDKGKQNSGLSSDEVEMAELFLLRKCQWECFMDEVRSLETGNPLNKRSSILKLSPVLNTKGLICLKGRTEYADDSLGPKRPPILDRSHRITKLIVDAYHRRYQHQGFETVVNEIRQRFWIPKIRVAVKTARTECYSCKMKHTKPVVPEMAPLPRERVIPYEPPFTYTGLDYFGPLEVTVGRHREKRYGVLFTCLSIRAVHIELASSLNTSSCIMAIRNFLARRATPKVIFCDNGTNFHATEKTLKLALEHLNKTQIVNDVQGLLPGNKMIDFRFNPPASPHMGGAWERMVRSVKTVLYTLLKDRAPREETLRSLLLEAENIVNSRPLTYRAVEPNEEASITPNQLLKLSPGIVCAPGKFENEESGTVQWRIAQEMADKFWKRWVREYLPEITRRTKWHGTVKPLQVNDLVVIVDDNAPRNVWRRGRVVELFPGKDGNVRSARIQTSSNMLVRPVAKLAILDVRPQVSNSTN